MTDFDAVLLSRLQFVFTLGFHILFPAITIGLGLFGWNKVGPRIHFTA